MSTRLFVAQLNLFPSMAQNEFGDLITYETTNAHMLTPCPNLPTCGKAGADTNSFSASVIFEPASGPSQAESSRLVQGTRKYWVSSPNLDGGKIADPYKIRLGLDLLLSVG